jgi:hypothetical protein
MVVAMHRATGHAPSDQLETTVQVISRAGSCLDRNEMPAS